MGLAPFGPNVPAEVQDQVNQTLADLDSGAIVAFAGPVVDQDGTVRVAEGEALSDEEMGGVDWFVAGVIGQPN